MRLQVAAIARRIERRARPPGQPRALQRRAQRRGVVAVAAGIDLGLVHLPAERAAAEERAVMPLLVGPGPPRRCRAPGRAPPPARRSRPSRHPASRHAAGSRDGCPAAGSAPSPRPRPITLPMPSISASSPASVRRAASQCRASCPAANRSAGARRSGRRRSPAASCRSPQQPRGVDHRHASLPTAPPHALRADQPVRRRHEAGDLVAQRPQPFHVVQHDVRPVAQVDVRDLRDTAPGAAPRRSRRAPWPAARRSSGCSICPSSGTRRMASQIATLPSGSGRPLQITSVAS